VTAATGIEAFAPIARLAGRTAEGRRVRFLGGEYDLTADGRTFARLAFTGAMRRSARLAGADGEWELGRRGFWRPVVFVRRAGHEAALAELERDPWGNGVLQFASGPRYLWRRVSFWRGRYALLSARERALVAIRANPFGSTRRLALECAPQAAESHELTVLAGVALYVRLMIARRGSGG
jgi:hypothetical protein